MSVSPDSDRKLRQIERKTYTDEGIDEDEIEGKRTFDVEEKLTSDDYNVNYVEELKGDQFVMEYFQKNGLVNPIVFYEKMGLGMRMPSENFQVSDVRQCVGARRILDVMDVNTQKGMEMSMREWEKYFTNPERKRLLNVISLEFSHTRLQHYIESPAVVRQIDWVDCVWPQHLKESQRDSTNIIDKMKYPKVQKYCLMSVGGCYTDFHIDFGGTSVWYHLLHGEKIFWLIPPTEKNLALYLDWVMSGKQGDVFFGDQVEGCQRIALYAGWTFIIPSGWIHAVFTPVDSMVFGGNFLHSFNIMQQLRCAEIEDKTHVPNKFRYPFFTELAWYVLERYVKCLTGKSFLVKPEEETDEAVDEKGDSKKRRVKKEKDVSDVTAIDESMESMDIAESEKKNIAHEKKMKNEANERISSSISDASDDKNASDSGSIKTSRSGRVIRKSVLLSGANGESEDDSSAASRLKSPSRNSTSSTESSTISGTTNNKLANKENNIVKKPDKPSEVKEQPMNDTVKHRKSLKVESASSTDTVIRAPLKTVHLTPFELQGLEDLIDWVECLPANKKGIPNDMPDPDAVLKEVKLLLKKHKDDDPKLAVTGKPILTWPVTPPKRVKKVRPLVSSGIKHVKGEKPAPSTPSAIRRRRTRCKRCEACCRDDCGECNFCKDMRKNGGPGRMKQSCISRQCMAPSLPTTADCLICDTDKLVPSEDEPEEMVSLLMECGICWEIVHPECMYKKKPELDKLGHINDDLPNSWECPKCCQQGKQGQLKPRMLKGIAQLAKFAVKSEVTTEDECSQMSLPSSPEQSFEGKRVTCSKSPQASAEKSLPSSTEQSLPSSAERKTPKSTQQTVVNNIKQKAFPLVKKFSPLTKVRRSTGTPSLKSPPVITRSGRRVSIKRSPDEMSASDESPLSKRPKHERSDDDDEPSDRQGMAPRTATGRQQNWSNRTPQGQKGSSGQSDSSHRISVKMGNGSHGGGASGSGGQENGGGGGDDDDDGSNDYPTLKELRIVLPKHVVRPAPIPAPPMYVTMVSGENHPLDYKIWKRIFNLLSEDDIARCLSVCRTWNHWCIDPEFWRDIDLSHKRIKQAHLVGIVRRQPMRLNLNYAVYSQKQLAWLLERIPQLKTLELAYGSWGAISSLCSSTCPLLLALNLNWSSGLRDTCFKVLISNPSDLRPAARNMSRMHRLQELHLSGTDIGDSSLRLLPQYTPTLEVLDLSYCTRITNKGIEYLTRNNTTESALSNLDISGCDQLTPDCLTFLHSCHNLRTLQANGCSKISTYHLSDFADAYPHHSLVFKDNIVTSA